jgi:(2Fe-2S) ferredoxin
MPPIERHFFVCENVRPAPGRPSCGARDAGQILAALREELARRPTLWGRVAVSGASCLGPCFEGPTIVVYPEGTWYAGVRLGDVAELAQQHMEEGRPVERLRYGLPDDAQ